MLREMVAMAGASTRLLASEKCCVSLPPGPLCYIDCRLAQAHGDNHTCSVDTSVCPSQAEFSSKISSSGLLRKSQTAKLSAFCFLSDSARVATVTCKQPHVLGSIPALCICFQRNYVMLISHGEWWWPGRLFGNFLTVLHVNYV